MLTRKMSTLDKRRLFRPPLPNVPNKTSMVVQSKQMVLAQHFRFQNSTERQPLLAVRKSNTDNNVCDYSTLINTYLRRESSKQKDQKSRSRISTSYSQQSLKENKYKNNHQTLQTCRKTPENILRDSITSKSWIIYDNQAKRVILEKGSHIKREAASITKIMTCITAIEFCQRFAINPKELKLVINKRATVVDGTSAELKCGHVLTLESLLYAMMLPSGNDAAFTIAQYIGTIITLVRQGYSKEYFYDCKNLQEQVNNCRLGVKNFLVEMNLKSMDIGMLRTHYGNPHGLSQRNNYSTCEDLVKLCEYSLKNRRFLEIVSCKQYKTKCSITEAEYSWQNTHKLLAEGWLGIKTGITPAAGPCLSSYFKGNKNGKYLNLIIILLNCNSMEQRYQQTKLLLDFALQKKNC